MKSGTGTEEKKKILPPTSERPAKGAPPEHLSDSSNWERTVLSGRRKTQSTHDRGMVPRPSQCHD